MNQEIKFTGTLVKCWLFKLNNSIELGFTDYDSDIVISGTTYYSNGGAVSHIRQTSSNHPDDIVIENVVTHDLINVDDILAGLYDGAKVEVFYVNPSDIYDIKWLKSGFITHIEIKGQKVLANVQGLSSALDQEICETYSENCRASLGDRRCKIDLKKYAVQCVVSKILDNNRLVVQNIQDLKRDYSYSRGCGIFSVSNHQEVIELLNIIDNELTFSSQIPSEIREGDVFTMMPGCDKTIAMCCNIYNNAQNFRGEPHIPNAGDIL